MKTTTTKPVLNAGLEGVWDGTASVDRGIVLNDHTDQNNLPCGITGSRQTHGAAYRIAAKVWPMVLLAKSMHEAARMLTDAGAKLHYFCRMD